MAGQVGKTRESLCGRVFVYFAKTLIGEIQDGVFWTGGYCRARSSGSCLNRVTHDVSACTNTRLIVALILEANLIERARALTLRLCNLKLKVNLSQNGCGHEC